MSPQSLRPLFDAILTPAASAATAPILAVGLGVLAFLVCDIVGPLRRARGWVFAATLLVAAGLELRLLAGDAPGVVLGGTFRAGADTAVWGLIFVASTALAWLYGQGYYRRNLPFQPEHDALLLCAPAGMMLMVGACDLVVFFVGLELLSIPLYALAAFRRARAASVEAGLKYFLLGSFSSAMLVYGAGLLYAATGTLSLETLFASDVSSPLAVTGIALVAASLFFKVSVFPFHLWVPDVYQGAPTPVTVLMASGTKAAAFGFLLYATRLLPVAAAPTVSAIALVTMALGNTCALVQSDVKRMLAYSSIAHAGTLLLLVSAGLHGASPHDVTIAALYYMGAYLFTASGAFGVLGLLEAEGESSTRLETLRGLGRTRPLAAGALALFMLSLGGIPATGGFLGKWFVFTELVRADQILVAVLGALLSAVALGYYLRVVIALYMEPAPAGAPPGRRALAAGLATALCCAGVLFLGLVPAPLLNALR